LPRIRFKLNIATPAWAEAEMADHSVGMCEAFAI